MTLTESKYERLDAIERLLAHNPRGLTTGELATKLGVDPSTTRRDMQFLQSRGTGLLREGRRYLLDHRRTLYTVKLSNHEVLALYLAARLLSRHSDKHNPHVVYALEKLADALRTKSPVIAHHIVLAAGAVRDRRQRPAYVVALEVVAQGWAEGRVIAFRYRSKEGQTTERTFCPYYLEPSSIGYACYVIGRDTDKDMQDLRTFKIERMTDPHLTDEHFSIPADFDPQRQLANAWGVIWRDEGSIAVTLRFAPAVVERLKESVWHHSQHLEDLPDGACLFTVQVGSTLEMKPWIRQWGADVVVVAPPDLRDEVAAEAAQTARGYGYTVQDAKGAQA